jgi:hypothetical protein
MKKFLVTGFAITALAGAANMGGASAQTAAPPPPAQSEKNAGPADNQIANDVDAAIADLKAKLRLTTDQEKNWSGLQSALHDDGIGQFKIAMEKGNRPRHRDRDHEDKDQADRPNDIALMRSMADSLTARGASLKKLADAADPLYATLDDDQKHVLFEFLKADFEPHRR